MGIQVDGLTKMYGTQRAVDQLSFSVGDGQVVGFLGPNGAGKTTTMKMLTGYLEPTSGSAKVGGFEVTEQAREVQKRVGYLPEHNPLYLDMYVKEYLGFTASLHGLQKAGRRIEHLIEVTGLFNEQHKLIGALSKGYRQRVGLAQALLHDPEVLILDEPTSGLDPNQLVEIRGLIKNLGRQKTVIFSTHIMQEVQQLCDRVLIINRGKLVADDPIEQLSNRLQGGRVVTIAFLEPVTVTQLEKINGVDRIQPFGETRFRLFTDGERDIRAAVFRFAVDQQLTLLELHQESLSVENVFQQLTA